MEWVHVRCGKAHPVGQDCPAGTDTRRDAYEVAAARLHAVVAVRDDLKRRIESGSLPKVKDVLDGLDKALGRETLAGPQSEMVDIVPDDLGFATARHGLDSERVSADRAWTADGVACRVVSCVAYGLSEVEVLTAPEARRVRLLTVVD